MKKCKVALLMALLLYSGISLAEEVPEKLPEQFPGEEEGFYEGTEGDVLITATRYIKRLEEAPAIASVITAEQIRNMGARDLMDVLKIVPGLGVYQEFIGKKTIEVRGIKTPNAEKVLIMIDGHPIHNVFYGGAMTIYDDLFVENIKRVEVIRGPGSALYGADAFLAVINVITKDTSDIDGVEVSAGAGSYESQRFIQRHNILFGTEKYNFKISGSFNFFKTDGPSLLIEEDAVTPIDKLFGTSASMAPGRTDDWLEKYDANLNISYSDFNFKGKFVGKRLGPYVGVTYALNDESRQSNKEMFGVLTYKKSLKDNLNVTAKGYIDQFDGDQYWEAFPEGFLGLYPDGMLGNPKLKNRKTGTEVQIDYILKNHSLVAGALYEEIRQFDVGSKGNFNPITGLPLPGGFQDQSDRFPFNKEVNRYVWAAYLQDDWAITDTLNLTLGLRFDHYNDFEDTTNPRAGIVWSFNKNGKIKFLIGKAFRAPNFIELYTDNNPAIAGNTSIEPEKIWTFEAGLEYRFGRYLTTKINYFHSNINDLISVGIIDGVNTYDNQGDVDVDGVEVELRSNWNDDSYAYANYTYQYAEDRETEHFLPDVPKHRGNVGLNLGINKYLNANTNILVLGSRRRPDGDTRDDLSPHVLADLTLTVRNFFKKSELRASVHNLFDQHYEDPAPESKVPNDFPRPGINFMIDFRYKF